MSYILDALKKSEQQRQRSAAQITLATPPATPSAASPVAYRHVLLALLLIAVGIAVGWLRPWQSPPPPPPAPAVTPAPAVLAPPPAPAASARVPPIMPAPAQPPVVAAPPVTPPPPSPTKVVAAPEAPLPVVAEPQATEQAPRVMALSELPASVRQALPALAISLHAYAREPRERIVMINNQMLRQGDPVAPGLRLEQITQDGVVLGYQGYRFHRGVR